MIRRGWLSHQGLADTVARDIAVEHHSGTGRKVPVAPDEHAVGIADNQTKMRALVVFDGDIGVCGSHRSGLFTGERSSGRVVDSGIQFP